MFIVLVSEQNWPIFDHFAQLKNNGRRVGEAAPFSAICLLFFWKIEAADVKPSLIKGDRHCVRRSKKNIARAVKFDLTAAPERKRC